MTYHQGSALSGLVDDGKVERVYSVCQMQVLIRVTFQQDSQELEMVAHCGKMEYRKS